MLKYLVDYFNRSSVLFSSGRKVRKFADVHGMFQKRDLAMSPLNLLFVKRILNKLVIAFEYRSRLSELCRQPSLKQGVYVKSSEVREVIHVKIPSPQ